MAEKNTTPTESSLDEKPLPKNATVDDAPGADSSTSLEQDDAGQAQEAEKGHGLSGVQVFLLVLSLSVGIPCLPCGTLHPTNSQFVD